MRNTVLQIFGALIFITALQKLNAQSNNPAPYVFPSYNSGSIPCNQPNASNTPGNGINDFINSFNTTGASNNIVNNNSGCCGLSNNYIYYGCSHYLVTYPNQTITCNIQCGMTYGQGFAVFVDWNQDNSFSNAEKVCWAGFTNPLTFTTMAFPIPPNQPNGTYRMRVKCGYAISGASINGDTHSSQQMLSHGETEDYNLFVGGAPGGIITATASVSSPTICSGQSTSLLSFHNGTSSVTYTWTGPNNYSSTAQNPILSNASTSMTGVYNLTVSNGACPGTASVDVTVIGVVAPTLAATSATICQGGAVIPTVTPLNLNTMNYLWTGPGSISPSPMFPGPTLSPPQLPANTTFSVINYTITISPKSHPCPAFAVLAVSVNNPSTPTLTLPGPLCNNMGGIQLTAAPGGGTWSANPAVLPGGLFQTATAALGTNTVNYTAGVGSCTVSNTGTLSVSKFNTAALTTTLGLKCVQDPTVNLLNIVQSPLNGTWSALSTTLQPYLQNNILSFTSSSGTLATGTYSLQYTTSSAPVNACPHTTILSLQVFNPPKPVINFIQPRCDNSSTVSLIANPQGGSWSGNSGVTQNGIQTPSLNSIGTNTVVYTAGQGTCVSSSSRTFEVSKFNTAALSSSITNLCANSTPVDLMSIVYNNKGTWTGTNVNANNFFVPAGLATATYILTYNNFSSPNTQLCSDMSTIAVHVLNPPMPNISAVGPLCSIDGAVQLSVTPAIGDWVTTSYLNSKGIFTPSLTAPGNNAVQYVIGTSTCNTKQTINIATEAFVPSTIVHQMPDLCNTGPAVNLMPLTLNNLGTWEGTGIQGSSFYPAAAGAGKFDLTYKTSSSPSGLCPSESYLTVRVFSLAPPAITQAGPFCNTSQPVQLKVSPVGGIFGGNNSNAVTIEGVFNPANAVIGSNIMTYSITEGPCLAYAQTTIAVQNFVSASFAKQLEKVYCKNADAFDLNSVVQNAGGDWSGPGVTGSMFHPSQALIGTDNLIVYRTYSSPNKNLCPDSTAVILKVKDLPKVSALSTINTTCVPVSVTFKSINSEDGTGSWNLGDGSAPKDGHTINHVYTKPGTYNVVYSYKDGQAAGCDQVFAIPAMIKVPEQPKADFSVLADEIFISDPSVRFHNESSVLLENRYEWTIQGGNRYFDVHPYVTFPQIGKYSVTLQAISTNGCNDQITKVIEVKNDFNVYIPNSFTPNYDGLNDVFKPVFSHYGLDHRSFSMEIFDRWGHLIYQTKDYTKGWDGTLQNRGDNPLKEDTYNYSVKYKDLNGNTYNKTGVVTLLH